MIGTPASIGTGFASDGANTVAITVANGGAAVGDLVTVFVGNDGGPNLPSGVTDSKGNTYAPCEAGVRLADNYAGRLFYSVITTALVNGDTITGTVNGGGAVWDKFAAAMKTTGNWSAADCLDKTSSGTGSGTAWASGSTATTAVADELVIGAAVCGGAPGTPVSTPGTNLTEIHDVNASSWVDYTTVYRVVSATGAYQANGTWATTDAWGAIVATFREAGAPKPIYKAAGAGASIATGASIAPAYPATVDADDIAFLVLLADATTSRTYTPPAGDGWALLGSRENTTTALELTVYWRRCTGSEDGATVTVAIGGTTSTATFARIYTYDDCITSGDPFEVVVTDTGTASPWNVPQLTGLGANRRVVCFMGYGDDDIVDLPTFGGSNVTWAENGTQFSSPTGGDGTIHAQSADASGLSTVNASSFTFTPTDPWISIAFALIPPASGNQTPLTVPATLTATPAIAMRVGRTLAVTSVHTPVLVRTAVKPRTLAVTMTAGVQISRQLYRTLAVGLTASPALVRAAIRFRAIAATVTLTPVISKQYQKALALVASPTLTPVIVRRPNRFLSAALTATPVVATRKTLYRVVSAGLTLTPAISFGRFLVRNIPANLTLAATMVTQFFRGQTIAAGLNLNPVIVRKPYRFLVAILTATPQITSRKTFYRTIAAGLSAVAAIVRKKVAPRTLSANVTAVAQMQLIRTGHIEITAGLPISTAVARMVNITLNNVVNLAGGLTAQGENMVPISLQAALTAQVAMFKVGVIQRALNVTLLLDRAISFQRLTADPDKDWLIDAKGIDDPQLDGATLDEAVLERTML